MATDSISPPNVISKLEERTCRPISIDTDEGEAIGKFDEQSASPLFTILPRELRDLIWAFATAPFEDPNAKFEENAYYYRPGHTAHLRTDATLLRTCRRVWLEANTLPMLQAEHHFYYHRAAPDKRDPAWMARLTDHNRQNFGQLRLFAQMYAIERLTAGAGQLRTYFLKTLPVPGDFQPRVLHVTLRHTDWWNWESEQPLRLQDSWVAAMLNSPDLRSTHIFRLEFETLDYKTDQLLPIVERIRKLESEEIDTHIVDGKPAKTKFVLADGQTTSNWSGPADINKRTYGPYEGKTRLSYHVVTLTWKLRFTEIPRAFVPELRRAPRISAPRRVQAASPNLQSQYSAWVPSPIVQLRRHPGVPRGRHDEAGRMRRLGAEVQRTSSRLAAAVEDLRRKGFHAMRGAGVAKACEARWKEEKSLLKFVD